MKRWYLLLCTSCALFSSVRSQGLNNIFSQKSSDLKSVAKQIALFELYIGWIEKGYKIAQEGLTAIGEIKNGEFNLHSIFFSSLSTVNPEIKRYSKVAIIISDEIFIVQNFKKILAIKNVTPSEMSWLQTIYSNMLNASTNSLNELIDVISDNTYQMTDDERIKRIDKVYGAMEEKVVLTKQITGDVSVLSGQRLAEENDIESLQNLE
jgi:hypothetical protein